MKVEPAAVRGIAARARDHANGAAGASALSSSCTAPAERSPDISSRAMSLRSSTGKIERGFGLAALRAEM